MRSLNGLQNTSLLWLVLNVDSFHKKEQDVSSKNIVLEKLKTFNFILIFIVYVYIYTKNRTPLFTVTDKIFAKLSECKIPTDSIIQQSQTNCGKVILGSGC